MRCVPCSIGARSMQRMRRRARSPWQAVSFRSTNQYYYRGTGATQLLQ